MHSAPPGRALAGNLIRQIWPVNPARDLAGGPRGSRGIAGIQEQGGRMVSEAPMEDAPGGKKPAGEGWFVINAREAQWIHNERFGANVTFEGRPGLAIGPLRFTELDINIQVLWPVQP